ncbi:GAP family protein [Promicromonospora sp. MS192]|uniref:GAP family protein n=1 Tax=Promicromonospora sp. MS192 TaxID=3412684 RepID=UPI003C2FD0F0
MNDDAAAAREDGARLAALERENAELRGRLDALAASGRTAGVPRPVRHRGRSTAAVVLIVLGALLAPVGVVAAWAERTLTDTDRYVATVAPLAEDPAVRSAVSARMTSALMEQIDVGALLDGVAEGLDEQGLAPRVAGALPMLEAPLTGGVESFVRDAADRVVASDQFRDAWTQANRVAHQQLVAVMRGEGGLAVLLGAVNPKNLLLVVSGGAAIAAAAPGDTSATVVAALVFAVVASVGVVTPVVIYVALGSRAGPVLDELRSWMVRNNAAIMAVLLLVLGAKMLGDGISVL